MRRTAVLWLALLLFVLAGATLAAGVAEGMLHVGFFIIFPVIYGSGVLPLAAFLLILIAFILLFTLPFSYTVESERFQEKYTVPTDKSDQQVQREYRSEFGGVIFIGPIPIIFGRGGRMTRYMIVVAAIIAVLLILYILLIFLK